MPRLGRFRFSTAWCQERARRAWCWRGRPDCCRRSSTRLRTWSAWAPRRSPPIAGSCRCSSEIAAHVGVPVATSSLMQVPWVQATLPPGKRVGIVTVSGSTLTQAHLAAAGVPADIPVVGTERGREFFRVLIKAEKEDMDIALAEQDILDAGRDLVARHPDIGAVVLECTNMPPYTAALRDTLGLPVYDVYSLITWLHAGVRPRRWM